MDKFDHSREKNSFTRTDFHPNQQAGAADAFRNEAFQPGNHYDQRGRSHRQVGHHNGYGSDHHRQSANHSDNWYPPPIPGFRPEGTQMGLPPRSGHLMTGSQFFEQVLRVSPHDDPRIKGVEGAARERAILQQIEMGNIPDFMRHPKVITVNDRSGNKAQLSVLPDYLAIGSNEDYVRVPITPILAKSIADRYGMALPTKKLVNDIYQQADVRLTGQGLVHNQSDTNYMEGNGFYLRHNKIINDQLRGQSPGALVAGEKKDIIISRFAATNPTKLDFYGLFKENGQPTQGSGGGPHGNTYVDYSHGARFISQDVIVNGQHMRYDDVLRDPRYASLLSDEGAYDPSKIYKNPISSGYQQFVV